MDCEQYTELISAAVDDALSSEEELILDEHLAVCPRCRSLLKELSVLDVALGECSAEVPEGFSQRVMEAVQAEEAAKQPVKKSGGKWKNYLATAAVLVLVVAGGSQLLQGNLNGNTPPPASGDLSAEPAFYGAEPQERSGEMVGQSAANNQLQEKEETSFPSESAPEELTDGAAPKHYGFSNEQSLPVTWDGTQETPFARVLGSTQSLTDFAALFPGDDLSALTAAYDEDYFRTGRLVAVVVEGSGLVRCELAFQGLLRDQVTVEAEASGNTDDDMTAWLILAEVDSMFDDGEALNVVLIQ